MVLIKSMNYSGNIILFNFTSVAQIVYEYSDN